MPSVVLASPAPAPPDPSGHPGWNFIESTWTDWRGTVWDLTNSDNGIFLRRGGIGGLGHTPVEHKRDRSPAVAGSHWRGVTYGDREVFWPIHLYSDTSSLEYIKLDRDWWRGLDPEETGRWTIRTPDTGERWIDLRMNNDDNWRPDLDPTFYGWATYGISLQAERPFWHGKPVHADWKGGTEQDFGANTNDVVYISSGNTLGGGKVSNPGDVYTDGIWKVEGPFSSIDLRLAGGRILLPVTRAAGKSITFDTRPEEHTVIDSDGVDLFGSLTIYDPQPIPPMDKGGLQDVEIIVAGTGASTKINLDFDPLYHRAW